MASPMHVAMSNIAVASEASRGAACRHGLHSGIQENPPQIQENPPQVGA
jgi:hypothetical protein